MASDRLSIRLPENIQRQLRAIVRSTGKSESEVVREALAAFCERQGSLPTCYDVAKKARFIGCVEGAADDLSTNPAHMEGFGRE